MPSQEFLPEMHTQIKLPKDEPHRQSATGLGHRPYPLDINRVFANSLFSLGDRHPR